ncbi:indoleacetamide hydrolase [Paraburkholderia sp. C35]|uniref:indoleacetamide hydrolase n=1 Tax=Paraburkholderia sp. C35 TaxID=2126993 RepID=UPI001EF3D937|nr:indoleacetamide hydrolase [Paraburkholderia sp. C35]
MSKSDQLQLTATQAVTFIRDGRLSAAAYMLTLLDRAEHLAGLNTLISLNRDGALAAAREVDAKRAAGIPLPPLAGLPIVVKDNINVAGMKTTGGTPALRDMRPTSNAPMVQRLIDAGAIVLGKANMHELAFGATSTNFSKFAGFVRNPYDETRVPGGSSGGTAAAVAARIVPAGLGTDTGGSVREPASLCGVAGYRPSVGNGGSERRYDAQGVLPISHTRDTIGVIARTMQDVALLDTVMSGRPIATAVDLRGIRLGVPGSYWSNIDPEVSSLLEKAKLTLRNAGITLVDVDTTGLAALVGVTGFPIALHEAKVDIPAFLTEMGVNVTLEDIAAQVASPDVKPIMDAVIEDKAAAEYATALHVNRPKMQSIFAAYFADNRLDGMVFPTMVVPAPVIDHVTGSPQVSVNGGPPASFFAVATRNTDAGSTSGLPGITIPAGQTAKGLPVGLGLDGPIGSDSKLLGIAMSIEATLSVLPAPSLG